MRYLTILTSLLLFLGAIAMNLTESKGLPVRTAFRASQPLDEPRRTILNINNITTWVEDNGLFPTITHEWRNGTYPKGTAGVIYAEGIVWGGKVNDGRRSSLRVGGSTYESGLVAGAILADATGNVIGREDVNSSDVRAYRVRPDWAAADLREDAASLFMKKAEQVTDVEIAELRIQYEKDWNEWPAHKGAPFEDRNGDGDYNPAVDVPGIPGAGQTIWYVANDLDSAKTYTFAGAPPTGLEMQMTLWAYHLPESHPLGNVSFKRVRLIYKGTPSTPTDATIDSMYIGQWADSDIGNAGDDYVGCDTLLALGYGYQSTPDEYEFFGPFILPPPAVGYDLLRGPLAPGSAGDSAYYDLGFRLGFKNLPLVSFSPLTACVQPQSPDYPLYYATLRWYNWMRGCRLYSEYPNCVPLQDHLGRATMFELSGDPVTGEGDIGAMHYPAEDFHFLMSSGPFTMAKGDTQEVLIALIGGLGNDNLSSIVTLRKNDIFTQAAHDNDFRFPNASVNVDFVNTGSEVRIQADCKSLSANSVKVALVKFDGSEVAEAELYDDGAHGDDAPEDSIFGNSISVDPQSEGLFLDLNVRDANGRTTLWPRLVANIPTVGPLDICEEYVASDNLNNDGKPNPGENVRFGFTIQNLSRNDVFELRVVKATEPSEFVYVNAIPSGQLFSLIYNPNDTTSYFSFDIPSEYQDSKFKILFVVTDRLYNSWIDTLTFPIEPFEFVFEFAEVQHLRGKADGNFGIRIIDPQLLKDHLYAIHGVDSIDAEGHIGISVKDSTDGRILLWNHLVPDELGHNVFPTDGFKIVRGSIPDETKVGMKPGDPFSTSDSSQWGWSIPSGERRWTWANANDLGLEGFHGAIGWDEPAHLFSGSAKTLKSSNLRNTLIKFAETDQAGNVLDPNDPNWSFAYRYLRRASSPPARREFAPFITNPDRGYAYQGYAKSVPFSAWDIEADPPRRLMVGHLENNVEYGKVDGKYWPPSSSEMDNVTNGAREWFFIFDVDYSETPDPRLMMEILGTPMPVMWWGTPNRRGDEAFQAGDEFAIFPVHYITSQDLWTFNPTITHVQESPLPFAYALYQNYPNPFNEQTTIRFSIPKDETVTLKVYNVLGQEVITLVQKRLERGFHEVQWQGKNSMNLPVPSGLYFCRMEAPDYAKVKKMLLLK